MTRAILRRLLALAPEEFRERYGAELLEVHDARRRGERTGGFWFEARELVGLAFTVLRLRTGGGRNEGTTTRGGGSMFETTLQDLRFAIRTLRRNPGFTTAAVVVLALGIGANTAIFSAANAFLFRPLPFGDADRLVVLYETNPDYDWTDETAAPANMLDWRDQVGAFADVGAYADFADEVTYIHDGEPELVGVTSVTGNFFSLLDVKPAVGRGFTWDETWEGNDGVVVLSHGFWVSHFGADPSVVGRTIEFTGSSPTIVGVMPEDFAYPTPTADLWTPMGWAPGDRQAVYFRRAHWIRPIARLRPGVTAEQADAALQVVVRRLQQDFPETNRVMGAGLAPMRDFLVADVRTGIMVLLGAVALLLLLACANVANLTLVRASDRAREVAVRLAMGAGRARIARQVLAEGLVLAMAGGALGLMLGWVGVKALATQRPIGIAGATTLALDTRVVLFTLAVSLLAGVLFSVAPAVRTAGGDVQGSLKESGRAGAPGRRTLRTVGGLVALEVGLSVLLVIGAGLMVRTAAALRAVDPGVRTQGVVGFQITLPRARYAERDGVLAFQEDFMRRLAGRPGISAAGRVSVLPLAGRGWTGQVQAFGWPPDRVGQDIGHRQADVGYFEVMKVPVVRGRMFGPQDEPDGASVVVLNETAARELFPGEDPIGQRIANDKHAAANPDSAQWLEIVGVVADQRQIGPAQPTKPEVIEYARQYWGRTLWFVVRTDADLDQTMASVREVLREMDPLVPLGTVRPMREVWRASVAQQDFILTLLGAFGVMALLLAAVGVYGVTAQAAKKRTQEIGIRLALGAQGGDVRNMMLRQGMGVVTLGLAGGTLAALLATRALATLLFGVEPTDPMTYGMVVGLLGSVAGVACWIPARRATTVDPVTSLRSE